MGAFPYGWRALTREILLIIGVLIFCIPLYMLLALSVKSSKDIALAPNSFPTHPDFANYSAVWNLTTASVPISRALVNSLIITIGSIVLLIVISAPCAYALARKKSLVSTAIYAVVLLGLIIPFQLGVVSVYVAMRAIHLVPSYIGMILLNVGLYMPLAVFLYARFLRALPYEYEEAAEVDGASIGRIFLRVVFPLLRPVTGTVAILVGILSWNDFFDPLVFLSGSSYQTLPATLYSLVGEYVTQWNYVFASIVIAIIPALLFYLVAQKQLIRGFTSGIRG
jgi:raffinose/stachyose/melibiose transport system permease protein